MLEVFSELIFGLIFFCEGSSFSGAKKIKSVIGSQKKGSARVLMILLKKACNKSRKKAFNQLLNKHLALFQQALIN